MNTKILFAGVLLFFAGTAWGAAILFTPTLYIDSDSGGGLECRLINVSAKDLNIVVEMYNIDGTRLKREAKLLKPRNQFSSNAPTYGLRYCKFIVNNGTKVDVRASINSFSNTGGAADGDRVALPAQ